MKKPSVKDIPKKVPKKAVVISAIGAGAGTGIYMLRHGRHQPKYTATKNIVAELDALDPEERAEVLKAAAKKTKTVIAA